MFTGERVREPQCVISSRAMRTKSDRREKMGRVEHMAKCDAANLSGHGSHQCAPREWRGVPKISGDYDLDATILHRHNKDLPHRLWMYTRMLGSGAPLGYSPRSGYHGYSGYRGDE